MEADSTTFDASPKDSVNEPILPFSILPDDFMLYKELISSNGEKGLEGQLVANLQRFGLIPSSIQCPTGHENCRVVSRNARVIDRVQWMCEGCGKKLPIRTGSFFLRIQCSILQTLQMILAWCEDADCEAAAVHFGVKPRVANTIYDKLDELAIKEQEQYRLGGEDSVVLVEMYPDCLMRLSPDTTDQPHVHRILMIADTKHVPTHYHLHVMKEDTKKNSGKSDAEPLTKEIQEVVSRVTAPESLLVAGGSAPPLEGATSLRHLAPHCDVEMQHFLTCGIWRGAVALCTAARDLCGAGAGGAGCGGAAAGGAGCGGAAVGGAGCGGAAAGGAAAGGAAAGGAGCGGAAQRYLRVALFRARHAQLFRSVLALLAVRYTAEPHG